MSKGLEMYDQKSDSPGELMSKVTSLPSLFSERGSAHWISIIGSPPVLFCVFVMLAAGTVATRRAWQLATLQVTISIGIPLLFIAHLYRRGSVSDFDLSIRNERTKPLLALLTGGLASWGILLILNTPRILFLIATAGVIQTIIFLLITRYWKISFHMVMASSVAVFAVWLAPISALPMALSTGAIGWSRVHLERHTIWEAIAGCVLGSTVVFVMLQFH